MKENVLEKEAVLDNVMEEILVTRLEVEKILKRMNGDSLKTSLADIGNKLDQLVAGQEFKIKTDKRNARESLDGSARHLQDLKLVLDNSNKDIAKGLADITDKLDKLIDSQVAINEAASHARSELIEEHEKHAHKTQLRLKYIENTLDDQTSNIWQKMHPHLVTGNALLGMIVLSVVGSTFNLW